jgi:D-aspartate ligase
MRPGGIRPATIRRLNRQYRALRRDGHAARPPAVILGSSVNALSFARSLGRRRVPVLLLDSERLLGGFTRYGEFVQLPSAEQHPEEWMDALGFLGSQLETAAVLLPTSDVYCLLVSGQRERLLPRFRFLVPVHRTVEAIVDKGSQYRIAQAAGIPLPRTWFPESAGETRRLSPTLPYPCLLKPYRSHAGRSILGDRKVVLVDSPSGLTAAYERLSASGQPFLIQEIVPGEDSALFGYMAFWDDRGQERAWMTKQKLRQYPLRYGNGSLQMSVDAPEVAELSRRLVRAFDYRGPVGIEFKFDARDGAYRLIEINPRTVSGIQLAIDAGVDLPWIAYRHLTEAADESADCGRFRVGVTYLNEEWDIQAYWALRKSGALGLWSWLRSIRGAKRAIGAWDDPLPLLAGCGRLLRACWRSVAGRPAARPAIGRRRRSIDARGWRSWRR